MSVKRYCAGPLVLAGLLAAPAAFAADATAGKAVFDKLCVACHSLQPGTVLVGPPLHGVVGRKAASAKEFTGYTSALKAYNVTWNEKTLDEFLTNPMTKVPGTMMPMPVPDAKDRADLISFLSTLKAK
jgi:cytochrome c